VSNYTINSIKIHAYKNDLSKKNKCPKCKSNIVVKFGIRNKQQNYLCKICNHKFVFKKQGWIRLAYQDYTIHKQTYLELKVKYHKSEKTIRKYFDELNQSKITMLKDTLIILNSVNCIFDTTFFGRVFGVMIFRINELDVKIKYQKYKNILHKFVLSETLINYEYCLSQLDLICIAGYKSFTVDGRAGVIAILLKKYPSVPIQMCIFHQVQIVLRYTTRNPKTNCGIDLKELILTLKNTTRKQFINDFKKLQENYKEFLNEYTINPVTNRKSFSHKSLRSAIRSINSHLKYLFTFQDYPELNIQPTSNSCDGSFSHWKSKVKLHRGISLSRKKQIITKLLDSIEA
jgi:transposase-like protein